MTSAVEVDGLTVTLLDGTPIVDGVSFAVDDGEVLGLVGESGCGKTSVALAMLGYARPGSRIPAGAIRVGGTDVATLSSTERRRMRGRLVSYVPQDPTTSLNPSHRVGEQLAEMAAVHAGAPARPVAELLELVQLPTDRGFARRYPHQLSGGQQQRVVIAMALALDPPLVVLDEPTTGLDVTTQQRILSVLDDLRTRTSSAFLYVTHDLAVVGELADRVAVMYGGRIVEHGPAATLLSAPRHPYAQRLVGAIPRADQRTRLVGIPGTPEAPPDRPAGCPFAPRCDAATAVCLEVMPDVDEVRPGHQLRCHHWRDAAAPARMREPGRSADVDAGPPWLLQADRLVATHPGADAPAVRRVSFGVAARECLALVGESGSGKTTIGRCVVGLHRPAEGELWFEGQRLAPTLQARPPDARRRIQMVFQNPDSSLNPRHAVLDIVGRPVQSFFSLSRRDAGREASALLDLVRLPQRFATRFPAELSGGEQQRVAIARALAAKPALIVCDEITSALDVSVQAAILDLLCDLRERLDTAFLFISHDLAVVRSIADRIAVLRDGELVEEQPTEQLFAAPGAPYTRALLAAQPGVEHTHAGPTA